ncbi:uncharacterized protein LOC110608630 [Manihot esculenta]|uniref:Uncharacterized protein n=1 Tax=Manihot esculenta TaxID=3983 RepID=A0A2C9WEI3_MANES|nr:uncharacterized protein LOC110608630 [Manihot esculenta]OAY57192.1 hypothetical protein MANES_02G078100v8 [Manihot esculenta]
MPSIAPFNIFMGKKKPKSGSGSDDLSTVKAAAWAWYQRGSGSDEEKPICEFLVTRTRLAHRPSRYKLEAMRVEGQCSMQKSSQSDKTVRIRTDSNSLLDAYEIQSISKRLDYLIESSNIFFNRDDAFGDDHHNNSTSSIKSKKKKKKKLLKGLWWRHAVVCGTREDVDTSAFVLSRPPSAIAATRVPVVKMATCRPGAAHAL